MKFCVNNNIIPQHLRYIQRHIINLSHHGSIVKAERLRFAHTMKILKLELNDAFRTLHSSRRQVFHLAKKLSQCIPTRIGNSFVNKQEQSLCWFYQNERNRINKKMAYLKVKEHHESIKISKKSNISVIPQSTHLLRVRFIITRNNLHSFLLEHHREK